MRFVYVVAFDEGGRFLMVRHRNRAWEMPGGRIEPGETAREAARREFLEETGRGVDLIEDTLDVEGGKVFCGRVGPQTALPRAEEVLEVGFFSDLPDDLSFPAVEYEKMISTFSRLLDEV